MMKTLEVQVNGGLGSRLRTAVGALAYCQAVGRRLVVHWPRVERSESLGVFPCHMSELYSGRFEECGSEDMHWHGKGDWEVLRDDKTDVIQLRTDRLEPFISRIGSDGYQLAFESLTARDSMAKEAALCDVESEPTIGVHVRLENKAPQCAALAWYFSRLGELDKLLGRESRLFLSCDHPSVAREFAERYGRRMQTLRRTFVYDYLGILRQCADAHILRRCAWVVGANHSSFSQHVALIRGARHQRDAVHANHVAGGRYEDASCVPRNGEFLAAMGR